MSSIIPTLQVLKYMGNKRSLLPWLIKNIEPYIDPEKKVIDLFAGTSSVGYALKPKYQIIANDIQIYSSTISEALLLFNKKIKENDFNKYLEKNYQNHLKNLIKIFNKYLEEESELLETDKDELYFKFSKKAPLLGRENEQNGKISKYFSSEFIKNKNLNPKSNPYILFSLYYSHTFFSLKQSIEIDSLRFAIDQISDKIKRSVYLSCLLSAINKSVSSTGHFAQHLNPKSIKSKTCIIKYRKTSIKEFFLDKLSDFQDIHINTKWKNEVYNLDYKKLIDKLSNNNQMKEIGLIYIDPPYTSFQYSRFYHIPETLIKYDYPSITKHRFVQGYSKGRYRVDRYQSKFSQSRNAKKSFMEMFELLSKKTDATLALSYSDNSLIKPINELIDVVKQFYSIKNIKNGHSHSAQGSKFSSNGKGTKKIHEHIIICSK